MIQLKVIRKFIGILLFILPSLATAGSGWISTGGELFRFDRNPWFLKNVETVNYCIQLDEATVSADLTIIEKSIEEAIAFWKAEFEKGQAKDQKGMALLGTQNFIYHRSCPQKVDLVFKLGYGALNKEEIEFLEDPKKYIGVTVRTSEYDKVNMRASGFIYISSDKGSNAYHNPGHLISQAWQNEALLKYALIHEMGHVFGISHSGAGLMSEVFMDQLLHKSLSKHYIKQGVTSYMHPAKNMRICSFTGFYNTSFFNVSKQAKCLQLSETEAFKYDIFEVNGEGEIGKKLGRAHFVASNFKDFSAKPITLIHLPPEQQVFSLEDRFLHNYMVGPFLTDISGKGVFFQEGSRKPIPLFMELKPESVSFVATINDKPETVLVYAVPNLMRYMFP